MKGCLVAGILARLALKGAQCARVTPSAVRAQITTIS